MIRFELPSLGADMDEGTLLEWKVAPGDEVSRGQVIAVVDTSKAAVDIEIWHPGVIAELLVEPGEKIPVGTPMATVLEPGEAAPAPARPKKKGRAGARAEAAAKGAGKTATTKVPKQSAKETAKETAKEDAKEAAKEIAKPPAKPASKQAAAPETAAPGGQVPTQVPTQVPSPRAVLEAARHPVSPAARRRGRELGVDVEALSGSGAGGAVTIADVERAAGAQAPPQATVPPARASARPSGNRPRPRNRRRACRPGRPARSPPPSRTGSARCAVRSRRR